MVRDLIQLVYLSNILAEYLRELPGVLKELSQANDRFFFLYFGKIV